jgi:hypothetical protein
VFRFSDFQILCAAQVRLREALLEPAHPALAPEELAAEEEDRDAADAVGVRFLDSALEVAAPSPAW